VELGFYGLGRMGGNMVQRLVRGGHRVVVGNRSPEPVAEAERHGAIGAGSFDALVERTRPPRVLWVMVPSGEATEHVLGELAQRATAGDVLVDGGNSYFRDSMRRAEAFARRELLFVDVGTSGGIWGLQNGYCMMVGGDAEAVSRLRPVLDTLAPPGGWAHFGRSGAGHFVKMVHNGIEYAMLQAYGEGFELLRASDFAPDLHAVARVWNRGSVVRSWLLELAERALAQDTSLEGIRGQVADSGEGRWTVFEAIHHDVPATAIAHSLFARFSSRQDDSYAMRFIAALRKEFGGHAVVEAGEEAAPEKAKPPDTGSRWASDSRPSTDASPRQRSRDR
jgi:6-phosphogluconate dehydrogenase